MASFDLQETMIHQSLREMVLKKQIQQMIKPNLMILPIDLSPHCQIGEILGQTL